MLTAAVEVLSLQVPDDHAVFSLEDWVKFLQSSFDLALQRDQKEADLLGRIVIIRERLPDKYHGNRTWYEAYGIAEADSDLPSLSNPAPPAPSIHIAGDSSQQQDHMLGGE
jgi:hypothetical protein